MSSYTTTCMLRVETHTQVFFSTHIFKTCVLKDVNCNSAAMNAITGVIGHHITREQLKRCIYNMRQSSSRYVAGTRAEAN